MRRGGDGEGLYGTTKPLTGGFSTRTAPSARRPEPGGGACPGRRAHLPLTPLRCGDACAQLATGFGTAAALAPPLTEGKERETVRTKAPAGRAPRPRGHS
ncbi:hypothetical protein GCM10010446_29990 [Streptomyces enissocaesilis]|uniref:Uncharacterized protein n=1 Tax=Streptomyces enissocaesilis TaxID=332589 RepID=A0ABP6JTM0_9ACTN